MHEYHGTGRGRGRFGTFLGVVNDKPRYHYFIGIRYPQFADGHGRASAPHMPTPFVYHNDEDAMDVANARERDGPDTYNEAVNRTDRRRNIRGRY